MVNRALLLLLFLGLSLVSNQMKATPMTADNCPVINSVDAIPNACNGGTYSLVVNISYTGGSTMFIDVNGQNRYMGVPTGQQIITGLIGDGTSGVLVEVTITETSCSNATGMDTYNEPNCSGGCPPTLNLTGTETGTVTYQVSQTITSTQDINSGANVVYDAGTSITLNTGFHAKNSSNFTATIGGCGAIINSPAVDTRQDVAGATTFVKAGDLRMRVAPNPVQDVATISYEIPVRIHTYIHIFDAEGRLVKPLLNGAVREAGFYREDYNLRDLPSGNYFITLRSGEKNISTQVIIAR